MRARLLHRVTATCRAIDQALRRHPVAAMRPAAPALVARALSALIRSKPALIAASQYSRS